MMNRATPTKTEKVPPLRAVRQARGLSLRETAALAEIDLGHLSRVERGQAALSINALARLANVLGLRELGRMLEPYQITFPPRGRRE